MAFKLSGLFFMHHVQFNKRGSSHVYCYQFDFYYFFMTLKRFLENLLVSPIKSHQKWVCWAPVTSNFGPTEGRSSEFVPVRAFVRVSVRMSVNNFLESIYQFLKKTLHNKIDLETKKVAEADFPLSKKGPRWSFLQFS